MVFYLPFNGSNRDYSGFNTKMLTDGSAMRFAGGIVREVNGRSSAANFPGTANGYIQYPSSTFWDWAATDFTCSLWIYNRSNINTAQGPIQIGKKNWNNASEYWSFGTNSGGFVQFYYWKGSTTFYSGNKAIPLNTWTHICMTHAGPLLNMYINGILDASVTFAGTPQTDGTIPLTIGAGNNGTSQFYYDGLMDDIRIYNRALSAGEVQSLYASALLPNDSYVTETAPGTNNPRFINFPMLGL